jgi:hypothetical protein
MAICSTTSRTSGRYTKSDAPPVSASRKDVALSCMPNGELKKLPRKLGAEIPRISAVGSRGATRVQLRMKLLLLDSSLVWKRCEWLEGGRFHHPFGAGAAIEAESPSSRSCQHLGQNGIPFALWNDFPLFSGSNPGIFANTLRVAGGCRREGTGEGFGAADRKSWRRSPQ